MSTEFWMVTLKDFLIIVPLCCATVYCILHEYDEEANENFVKLLLCIKIIIVHPVKTAKRVWKMSTHYHYDSKLLKSKTPANTIEFGAWR